MSNLTCRAEVRLDHLPDYLHLIVDRLKSFDAEVTDDLDRHQFRYPFGTAVLARPQGRLSMQLEAANADGLQRLRELATVAVQIYAKAEQPNIVWEGDLAGDSKLVTFRKMRVVDVGQVTPHMRRVRLAGDDLGRYGAFGGMHVRVLFPTADNPDPVWPVAGPNGLPQWPSEERRPAARVYTIRHLDIAAGHMDLDFVVHGPQDQAEGIGAAWAAAARTGDEVGIIGPLGRPVRAVDWYVFGCDETGLPAVGRMLERLPASTRGHAFIEVADAGERQELAHPDGVTVNWIYRNGVAPGEHGDLLERVAAVEWPEEGSAFGWFAAEHAPAARLRQHWRERKAYGRDQTLVAAYWRRGAAGLMAG